MIPDVRRPYMSPSVHQCRPLALNLFALVYEDDARLEHAVLPPEAETCGLEVDTGSQSLAHPLPSRVTR